MFKLTLKRENGTETQYSQSINYFGSYIFYRTDKKIPMNRHGFAQWTVDEPDYWGNPFGAVPVPNGTLTVTNVNTATRTVTVNTGDWIVPTPQFPLQPLANEPIRMNHVEAMAEQVRQTLRRPFIDEDVPF